MSRLKSMSAKRRKDLTERAKVCVEVQFRDGHHCRAEHLVPHIRCGGVLDVHEIIPRSAWAAGWLVVDNCVTICRSHHEWVDANPDDAHAVGLHGYSWERPATTATNGDDE